MRTACQGSFERLGYPFPGDLKHPPAGENQKMLLFKKKFLPAIRQGDKTQTIRLWKHRMMKAGQRSYIPGAGYIRVTAVEKVDIDHLSDEDARPDGFATADQLRAELAELYADKLAQGYNSYRVVFHLLEDTK